MIDSVVIHRFKSIRELNLDLKPINVLIGSNGAGKSNFISFFKLLNVLFQDELKSYVATHGKADNFLYFGSKESKDLEGEIIFFDEELERKTNGYYFKLIPNHQNFLILDEERSLYSPDGENWNYIPYDISDYKSWVLHNNDNIRDTYLQNHFESFAIYHFHDTSRNAPLRKECKLRDNRFLREDGGNLAAFLYYLEKKHPKHFKLIEQTIKSIAPFFKRFALEPDALDPELITLEWEEEGSDMYLNTQNFSDGTLRMIALTTLLLQPNPPSTIIIDEPELGLHPFAINKLAGLIKKASAKSQVIISTQSINLVDNFDPEDIITVDREDKQSVFKRLDSNTLKEWLEDYSIGDLWTKNLIGGQP